MQPHTFSASFYTPWTHTSDTWPHCPFSCSLTCGVILQHGVFTKGLELPGDQDILRIGGGGVVAAQDDGGKEGGSPLRLRDDDLDAEQLWNKQQQIENSNREDEEAEESDQTGSQFTTRRRRLVHTPCSH